MRMAMLVGLCVLGSWSGAHAGDVTAVVKGGKLSVAGGADAEVVTIDQPVAGELRLTPGVGTTVNGVAASVSLPVSRGVSVDLGAGDDALTCVGVAVAGDLKLDLGAGFDAVALHATDVTGAATVDLGDGAGQLAACEGSIGKSLVVKAGAGGIGAAAVSCAGIDGTAIDVADGTAILLGRMLVDGGLAVKTKRGTAKLLAFDTAVVGKAVLRFGDGSALVGFCDAAVTGALDVAIGGGRADGRIDCVLPGRSALIVAENGLLVADSTLGASLAFKGGDEGNSVFVVRTDVGTDAQIALGDGVLNTAALAETSVARDLVVKGGDLADFVQSFFAVLTVGRDASFLLGDGENELTLLTGVAIGRDLTVKTGDGDDVIDTAGATVGGATTIKHGAGNDTVP